MKSSLKDITNLPSWDTMSKHWKANILSKFEFVWTEEETRNFCGVMMDPVEFLPLYMRRFLGRRELEDNVPVPGTYYAQFKVG